MAASYFDVDGTLVRTSLIHPTLFYLTHQRTPFRSMLKLGRAVMRAPQMAWAEMQDRRLFNEASRCGKIFRQIVLARHLNNRCEHWMS